MKWCKRVLICLALLGPASRGSACSIATPTRTRASANRGSARWTPRSPSPTPRKSNRERCPSSQTTLQTSRLWTRLPNWFKKRRQRPSGRGCPRLLRCLRPASGGWQGSGSQDAPSWPSWRLPRSRSGRRQCLPATQTPPPLQQEEPWPLRSPYSRSSG